LNPAIVVSFSRHEMGDARSGKSRFQSRFHWADEGNRWRVIGHRFGAGGNQLDSPIAIHFGRFFLLIKSSKTKICQLAPEGALIFRHEERIQ
jgi:hypothetical protein